jgi:hypothetical protein
MSAADLELRFPLPPNLLNPGRYNVTSWVAAWRTKKAFTKACEIIGFARVPRTWVAPNKALVQMHFVLPGLRDQDNLDALRKFPLDALRQIGVIQQDNPKHVDLKPATQEVIGVPRRRKREDLGAFYQRRQKVVAQWGTIVRVWIVR